MIVYEPILDEYGIETGLTRAVEIAEEHQGFVMTDAMYLQLQYWMQKTGYPAYSSDGVHIWANGVIVATFADSPSAQGEFPAGIPDIIPPFPEGYQSPSTIPGSGYVITPPVFEEFYNRPFPPSPRPGPIFTLAITTTTPAPVGGKPTTGGYSVLGIAGLVAAALMLGRKKKRKK